MFRFPVAKDGRIDYAAPSNVFFGVTPKPISAPKGSQSSACDWGMLRKYAIAGIHPLSATIADQIMIMIAHGEQGSLVDLAKAAVAAVREVFYEDMCISMTTSNFASGRKTKQDVISEAF